MIRQAEVIVRGKIEQLASVDDDPVSLRRIHAAQFAMQPLFANGRQASV